MSGKTGVRGGKKEHTPKSNTLSGYISGFIEGDAAKEERLGMLRRARRQGIKALIAFNGNQKYLQCRCGEYMLNTWKKRAMREPICFKCSQREKGELALMMMELDKRKKEMRK